LLVAILFALALHLDAEAVDALGRALGAGQAISSLARLMWPTLWAGGARHAGAR
jgi:hypothetical protein